MNGSSPTISQYESFAIAITKSAFNDYCECLCDLYCIRHPTINQHTKKRNESIRNRAIKASENTDASQIKKAMLKEKELLRKKVKMTEKFFDTGVCGEAFCFEPRNSTYFNQLSDQFIKGFIKTGVLKP